ncbi:MAG: RsmB/NOP family class I SAM-dependent RNA methyltransferase [Rhodothermales bacterium]|nr:RsmB/NOP family class I SAM-dependent RNA methyltransferase [Rhodothermales bacterium]
MTGVTTIFERYADIAGSAQAFRGASTARLPLTAWANPPLWPAARGILPELDDILEQPAQESPAFRVTDGLHPAFVAARLLGALHIQEEAAMLPVLMLDPGGGQRILDACSAPGNKTAAIAARLGPAGRVIAVDISESRMGVLRTTLNTLGIVNVAGVQADAAELPDRLGMFDAAMVDVPCSCEGTSRKHADVVQCISDDARRALSELQARILRSVIRHVRPGGRIVYATCTYAPEENEGVVADVIEHPEPDQGVRVLPCSAAGFTVRPGLQSWRGRTFPDELRHAKRLWPHLSDTGGFFAVLLEKTGRGCVPSGQAVSGPSADLRPVRVDEYPWSAYRIDPDAVDRLVTVRTGSKYSSVVSASLAADDVTGLSGVAALRRAPEAPAAPDPAALHIGRDPSCLARVLFAGMRGLNLKGGTARPSTAAAIRFGAHASRGILEISSEDVRAFMRRESVPVVRFIEPNEPVPVAIVRAGGCALGLGRLDASAPGHVQSLFPKVRAGINVGLTLRP